MRRPITATLAFVLTLAACSGGGTSVSKKGHSVRDGVLGVAALVRVTEPLRDVELEVTVDGRTESDTLPFCVPGADCWWGTSLVDQADAKDVEVRVADTGRPYEGGAAPRELHVTRGASELGLRAPGAEGTVYVVAFRDGSPRYATATFTRRGERTTIRYRRSTFPVRDEEEVRAFFYPGRVPASVYGPAD